MLLDLERFVTAHCPCGVLTIDVGELTETGYADHRPGTPGRRRCSVRPSPG